jgi:hypothetical protein
MKGRKGSVDEGGLRSPLLIRWPGHIQTGARIPQIAAAIDLLPTLGALAGVPLPAKKPLDGVNLQPLLSGRSANWPDRMIFSLQRRQVSVRTQSHRLDHEGRLFDMADDPGQDRDISKEEPEIAARLRAAARAWEQEVLPLVGPDDRPFPVGHAPATLLPARDGVPGGGVERSASAPNCSYFTNWRTPEGFMEWDIEVAQAGGYEAEIFYTCAAGDAGSAVELSFLGSRIEARIGQPHDPPLRGAAADRVPRRGESYVKDFKPLKLGVIRLKEGRGKLTLRALRVAAAQVADVRYIRLTRT